MIVVVVVMMFDDDVVAHFFVAWLHVNGPIVHAIVPTTGTEPGERHEGDHPFDDCSLHARKQSNCRARGDTKRYHAAPTGLPTTTITT